MAQATYTKFPAVGVGGMLASSRPDNVIFARAAEGTLTPGRLVTRGTNPATQAVAVNAAADITDNPLGILLNSGDTDADTYADGAMVNVLRKGHCWVVAATAAAVGAPVLAADADGVIHGTAAAGRSTIPGSVFLTAAGAGELAEIELDLVGQ